MCSNCKLMFGENVGRRISSFVFSLVWLFENFPLSCCKTRCQLIRKVSTFKGGSASSSLCADQCEHNRTRK